jgi:hypothetical protein
MDILFPRGLPMATILPTCTTHSTYNVTHDPVALPLELLVNQLEVSRPMISGSDNQYTWSTLALNKS